MHNLDAKDILTPQHVVKIEEYDKHMLIVLNSSYYDTNMEINSEHISILITGNVVISFTESNNPVFENAYKAIESNMLNIRRKNSGLLLAFLLNTIIANLVESASKVEEMLEDIEETLLDIKNDQGNMAVSYTHLDVYKRQYLYRSYDLPVGIILVDINHQYNIKYTANCSYRTKISLPLCSKR